MKKTEDIGNAGQLDPDFGDGGVLDLKIFSDRREFEIFGSADLQDGRSVHVVRAYDDEEYYLVSFDKHGALIHREQVILPYETLPDRALSFRIKYSQLDRVACYLPNVFWPSEDEADPIIYTSAVGCFLPNLKPQPEFGENGIATITPADLGEKSANLNTTPKFEALDADHAEAPVKRLYQVTSGEAQLINGAMWSVSSSYHEFREPPFESWISKFDEVTGKLLSAHRLEPLGSATWEPADVHYLKDGGFIMLAYREQQGYLTKFTDTGMLDTAFNKSGYVEIPGLNYQNSCMHVHRGRILIASTELVENAESLLTLDAYLLTGQRDSTFQRKSEVVKDSVIISSPHIAVDAKSRILVGFTSSMIFGTSPAPFAAMIYRFDWAGNADLSFGDAGRFVHHNAVQFRHMFLNGSEIRGVARWFDSQKPFMFKVLG